MSEKKQQNVFVPLRVRLRTPADQAQSEHEHPSSISPTHPPTMPDHAQDSLIVPLPSGTESAQRTQQIKELLRLGNILRAELGLDEVLQQIIASISACTGFRLAVINLVEEDKHKTSPVAFSGASEDGQLLIRENPLTLDQMHRLMRSEFRMSQSYFIPHQYADMYADVVGFVDKSEDCLLYTSDAADE